MTLIESKILGTAQSSIEFTSIPQDGTDLVVCVSLRSAKVDLLDGVQFRFNGDTGSNYTSRQLYGTGSGVDSSAGTISSGNVGPTSAANSTSNTFGNQVMYIPNYTGSTAKSVSCDSVQESNQTESYIHIVAALWTGTAAITSLTIFSAASANFVVGSTISLYKITKGSDGIVTTS
jgi:hypothetical protein